MSKIGDKAMAMFNSPKPREFIESFEVQEASKSRNFGETYVAEPLTKEEDSAIQNILFEESAANADEQVAKDHQALVDITTQIRAIERQNILLHGERIRRAQEVLKSYKEGAFSKWLKVAYGNRQHPYRMLQYCEFFHSLTGDVKQLMQSMPKKAAYVLASREGDQEKKIEIIRGHHNEKPEDIIRLVQEMFPLKESDGRKLKANDTALIDQIRGNLKKLKKRKGNLSELSKAQLFELSGLIADILGDSAELEAPPSNVRKVDAFKGDSLGDRDAIGVDRF